MSEFEYQEDPYEDAWAAAYEEDPVQAQYALALAAQAKFRDQEERQLNEQRVAVNAASMMAQAQHEYGISQHLTGVSKRAVGSMHAQYGGRFARAEGQVKTRLESDPSLSHGVDFGDAQQVADFLERQMIDVESNSPNSKYWNKVVQSGQRHYWQGLDAHDAEHGTTTGRS